MARSRSTTAVEEKGDDELEAYLEQSNPYHHSQTWLSAAAAYSAIRPPAWFSSRTKTKQLSRTAYLDGLRGFAALLVYCTHHHSYAHEDRPSQAILNNAFGFNDQFYFASFHFVRVFFSGGHTAVAIFFVISGYVLSAKPLSLIQARDNVHAAENLGSALFRRWIRLFLPVLATTFIWMMSWHALRLQSGKPGSKLREQTFLAELWVWYCDMKNYSFIFVPEIVPSNQYNYHTWTIPLEFRGSMVVYATLLAFARVRTNIRLWCEFGLILYFLYVVDGYYCALFVIGLLLHDLDMLSERHQLPEFFSHLKPVRGWIYYVLLLASLYLAGVPSDSLDIATLRASPGWYLLSFLKPQAFFDYRWFFRVLAGTFAMIAIPRIPRVKGFFEGSFCQYLGKISYGFYLVHGPVLWSLGDRLYAASGIIRENSPAGVPGWINCFPFPSWGPFGLEVNYLVPHLILLPFTLWLAEIVTRLIDEPSVRFSQWLFKASIEEPKCDTLS